jgi:hypothetical protein
MRIEFGGALAPGVIRRPIDATRAITAIAAMVRAPRGFRADSQWWPDEEGQGDHHERSHAIDLARPSLRLALGGVEPDREWAIVHELDFHHRAESTGRDDHIQLAEGHGEALVEALGLLGRRSTGEARPATA